jgi:RNA polymerase sigma factor (TIGR02999 family)
MATGEEHPLPQEALLRLEASTASTDVRRIAAELLPAFYEQLRRIAKRTRGRFGAGPNLQTTELVHEAYLRLGKSRSFADETHFLRASALAMRHALINHAQSRLAGKRGGGGPHVTLSQVMDLSIDTDEGMLALHEALDRLAKDMPRLADVVECRFFGGYGEEDTARALGLSLRTVQRDWLKARAWLFRELGGITG